MVQRKVENAEVASNIESGINAIKGSGQPLAESARSFFEPRFGYDFSSVRVHTDSAAGMLAETIHAKAFTVGNDIAFGRGHYTPGTSEGKRLIAHELAHVIQQNDVHALRRRYVQRQADIKLAPPGLSCILATGAGHSAGVDILFPAGKATISPAYSADIDAFVSGWVAGGSRDAVFVNGYSSTEGAQSVNWRLSCKRAEAVKAELMKRVIPADKIATIAHGESTEFSTADLAPNRRAIISTLSLVQPPTPPPSLPPQPTPVLLKSIRFTSDHGSLNDNNSDWSDAGTIVEPEWITNPAANKAISQTKNTRLTVDVTVNAASAGVNFDLIGLGLGASNVSFKKTGNTSTGSDQVISLTADDNLPNAVSQLQRFIVWKIRIGNKEQLAGFTGPHKIYVTYGTPTGGTVTEKRMEWAGSLADGKDTPETIADAIGPEAVSSSHFGGNFNLSNPWTALASNGDCGTLSTLMKRALEILGVAGSEIRFVYPRHSSWTNLWTYQTTSNETKSGGVKLGFISGGWNNYEGTCFFNSKWWMGGAGEFRTTPLAVLLRWTLPNNNSTGQRQVWADDHSTPVSYPSGTP